MALAAIMALIDVSVEPLWKLLADVMVDLPPVCRGSTYIVPINLSNSVLGRTGTRNLRPVCIRL